MPLRPTPAYDVGSVAKELVAEMMNAVATVQFVSAAQRDLGARKAIPALRGKVRQTRNRTDEHLPRHAYPRGATSEVAHSTLILTQDVLLEPLLDWDVEHQDGQTIAGHEEGSRLVLQVAQHSHAGWGLVVSLRPAWTMDAHGLNDLNARSARGLGHWTQLQDTVEHRVFVTSALLEAAEADVWAPAQLVAEVVTSVAGQRNRSSFNVAALQRPVWPGDEVGEVRARRDPWNDARDDDDPEWYAIYLDLFGRMSTLTEPSYLRWLEALTDQDLVDSRTAGFIKFMEARIIDR